MRSYTESYGKIIKLQYSRNKPSYDETKLDYSIKASVSKCRLCLTFGCLEGHCGVY